MNGLFFYQGNFYQRKYNEVYFATTDE